MAACNQEAVRWRSELIGNWANCRKKLWGFHLIDSFGQSHLVQVLMPHYSRIQLWGPGLSICVFGRTGSFIVLTVSQQLEQLTSLPIVGSQINHIQNAFTLKIVVINPFSAKNRYKVSILPLRSWHVASQEIVGTPWTFMDHPIRSCILKLYSILRFVNAFILTAFSWYGIS